MSHKLAATYILSSLAVLSLFPAPVASADTQAPIEEIAARFFPESLAQQSREFGAPGNRRWGHATGSWNGMSHLAVLYCNEYSCVVRLIRLDGQPSVVAENEHTVSGSYPKVALKDLDGDAAPEIITSCVAGGNFSIRSAYRYKDGVLDDLTPGYPADVVVPGLSADIDFMDIDGDGKAEALVPYPTDAEPGGMDVFSLGDDGYSIRTRAVLVKPYVRGKGEPVKRTSTFGVSRPDAFYRMLVISGEDGKNLAHSAKIELNGVEVVRPDAFKDKAGLVRDLDVRLRIENTITVELRGTPKSVITVVIREVTAE